jgi:adenosylcobinamide kinase/adenosylcobinamide-phosphate guanylyltransferase
MAVEDPKKVLILGGARSGKSSFAEEMAYAWGKEDVTYIATAKADDEEMEERIKRHKEARPSEWKTVEEAKVVADRIVKLAAETDVILLDCLTVLISNILLKGEEFGTEDYHFADGEEKSAETLKEIKRLAEEIEKAEANIIIVSNEVGQGLVPPYPLSRVYRDTVGRANQILAEVANEVYISYAGLPVEIKELGKKTREQFGGYRDDS